MITDAKQTEKDETKSNNTPNKTHKKGNGQLNNKDTRVQRYLTSLYQGLELIVPVDRRIAILFWIRYRSNPGPCF